MIYPRYLKFTENFVFLSLKSIYLRLPTFIDFTYVLLFFLHEFVGTRIYATLFCTNYVLSLVILYFMTLCISTFLRKITTNFLSVFLNCNSQALLVMCFQNWSQKHQIPSSILILLNEDPKFIFRSSYKNFTFWLISISIG